MNRRHQALARRMNERALKLYAELGRNPRCAEVRDWGDLWRKMPNEELLPRRELEPCGTKAAYYRHRRNGEEACDACKEANAAAKRAGTGRRMGRNAA